MTEELWTRPFAIAAFDGLNLLAAHLIEHGVISGACVSRDFRKLAAERQNEPQVAVLLGMIALLAEGLGRAS